MSHPVSSAAAAPRVTAAIASAAQRTGVDFAFLMQQAKIESGMNPQAQAHTSSASGLFQFTRQTWLATVKAHGDDHGLAWAANAIQRTPDGRYHVTDPQTRAAILNLRFQPEAASAMAAQFASDNGDFLADRLGRAAEPVDLYLAHFLGAGGAARFLSAHDANPDAAAAPLLPQAAAANRAIFYRADGSARSLSDIRKRFATKFDGAILAGDGPSERSGVRVRGAAVQQPVATPVLAPLPATVFPVLRTIEPMPQRLSLDFAQQAYRRLAALDATVHP
jgi:hypothetical protein